MVRSLVASKVHTTEITHKRHTHTARTSAALHSFLCRLEPDDNSGSIVGILLGDLENGVGSTQTQRSWLDVLEDKTPQEQKSDPNVASLDTFLHDSIDPSNG